MRNKVCNHCQGKGHIEKMCFKKHTKDTVVKNCIAEHDEFMAKKKIY